jgi:hypothetical protein
MFPSPSPVATAAAILFAAPMSAWRTKPRASPAADGAKAEGRASAIMGLVPPSLCFRLALLVLVVARRLWRARLIGRVGLSAALRISEPLLTIGRRAWRIRRRRLQS